MTCAETYQVILEADLPALTGTQEGPLARHLSECPRCRKFAQLVIAGEAEFGRTLSEAVSAPDLDEILKRGASPRHRWRRTSITAIPLAAAATMAGLFLAREPQLPGSPYVPAPTAVGLDIEAPEGRNVAVLATNNPDITVLWLF